MKRGGTSEAATILARELGRRAGPCRLLSERVADLKNHPAQEQPRALLSALDEGLRDCHCSWVDIDALEYLSLRLLNYTDVDYFVFRIPRDDQGRFVLPGDPNLTVEQWIHRL